MVKLKATPLAMLGRTRPAPKCSPSTSSAPFGVRVPLVPHPWQAPHPPLCISQPTQRQRRFFPSPSWELTAAAHPWGGEDFSPKPPLPHRMAAQEPSEDRALWAAPAPWPKRRRPFVLLSEGAGSELSELSSRVEINVITDTSQRGLWMRI